MQISYSLPSIRTVKKKYKLEGITQLNVLWIKQQSDWKQIREETVVVKPYSYVHRMNQILVLRTFKRFITLILALCTTKATLEIHVILFFLLCTVHNVNSVMVIFSSKWLVNKQKRKILRN